MEGLVAEVAAEALLDAFGVAALGEEGVETEGHVLGRVLLLEHPLHGRRLFALLVLEAEETGQAELVVHGDVLAGERLDDLVVVVAAVVLGGDVLLKFGEFEEVPLGHCFGGLVDEGEVFGGEVGVLLEVGHLGEQLLHVVETLDFAVVLLLPGELLDAPLQGHHEVAVVAEPVLAVEVVVLHVQVELLVADADLVAVEGEQLVKDRLVVPVEEERRNRVFFPLGNDHQVVLALEVGAVGHGQLLEAARDAVGQLHGEVGVLEVADGRELPHGAQGRQQRLLHQAQTVLFLPGPLVARLGDERGDGPGVGVEEVVVRGVEVAVDALDVLDEVLLVEFGEFADDVVADVAEEEDVVVLEGGVGDLVEEKREVALSGVDQVDGRHVAHLLVFEGRDVLKKKDFEFEALRLEEVEGKELGSGLVQNEALEAVNGLRDFGNVVALDLGKGARHVKGTVWVHL